MTENSVIYILNRKKERQKIKKIITCFNLNLCYDEKGEQIFKNNEILIACHRRYTTIQSFKEGKTILEKINEVLNNK